MKTPRIALTLALLLLAPAAWADVVCVSNNMCCQSAGGGVSSSSNTAWTGTNSFVDNSFSIIGSTTASKVVKFEVDGLTAATTRTLTVPDVSMILAGTNTSQTFSGDQVIAQGGGGRLILGNFSPILLGPISTNGSFAIGGPAPYYNYFMTGSGYNGYIFTANGGYGFDFALPTATDPTIWITSHNISATQVGSLAHNGTNFVLGNTGTGGIQLSAPLITSGTAPTCAITGAVGTGATCALETGSTNTAGNMLLTIGTTPASFTAAATLTFAGNLGTNAPVCVLAFKNNGATWSATAQYRVAAGASIASVVFSLTNGVTVWVDSDTYDLSYICVGK